MSLDFFGWAVQGNGLRLSFPIVQNNGEPRTGLVNGDFTVTVVNPADDAASTPTVSELSQKAGQYTALVPASFLNTHGPGIYHVIIEVDTFSGPSGAPQVRNTFGGPVKITARDVDDLAVGNEIVINSSVNSGGTLEVAVWLLRAGQVVTSGLVTASITIRDSADVAVTPTAVTSFNTDGAAIFSAVSPPSAIAAGSLYTIDASITDGTGTVSGQQRGIAGA